MRGPKRPGRHGKSNQDKLRVAARRLAESAPTNDTDIDKE
jgi:hypothetical protein